MDSGARAARFRHLADEYFDQVYFKYSPTQGTLDGFHQYDNQLEDYSRAGIDRQISALQEQEAKFAAVSPAGST